MIATTRGALVRGSTLDALGDEVDGMTVAVAPIADLSRGRRLDDFPVSIVETTRGEFDESSNSWRSVRYYVGRVPTYVTARAGDRIRDNRTGAIFAVVEVEVVARGLSGRGSATLTMKRTAP